MNTTFLRSASLLALAAALAAAPSPGHAQGGFFVGLGAGLGRVSQPSSGVSQVGLTLHLRGGWRFNPSLALVVEGSANTLDGFRLDSAASPDPNAPERVIKLETEAVLASLQIGAPRTFYVRPGVGFARHAFNTLTVVSNDQVMAGTSFEWSPAAGITVGREVHVIPGFPLNVEGVARWSSGEDSTSPRWSAGVQVVHDFHF